MSSIDWDEPYIIRKDIKLGYLYFLSKTHPLRGVAGIVRVHRHIASLKIGRWLRRWEHVHHIDGNKENNDPANLAILTNSEHAKLHMGDGPSAVDCARCGTQFQPTHRRIKFCSQFCFNQSKRLFNPDKEELERLVWAHPTTHLEKVYGVTDVAIAKRCKILGVPKPPRGYWAKQKHFTRQ